ncbi:MAG TPA: hypothetical protein VGF98_06490 [Candidatus Tumulicola sp.]
MPSRLFSRWDVAIGLYAIVAVCAIAGVLLVPGTLGHHWDWLIPADPAELRRLAGTAGLAWQDFDFGSYVTFHYSTQLTSFLFGVAGFLNLNGGFVTKSLVFFGIFGSGAGMRFLLLSLTHDRSDARDGTFATFGGLIYALAPFTYNQIIAGDQSAVLGDALSPFAIGLALRSVLATRRVWLAYALGSSLLMAVIVASSQVYVFTTAIMYTICLLTRAAPKSLLRLATVSGASVALAAFWVVPGLLAGDSLYTVVQTGSLESAFATYQKFSNPLMTFTTVAFPGDFYFHALGRGAPAFFTAYALLVALCVIALIKRPSPLLAILGGVFALAALLPLGGNPIVGPAIIAVFKALLPFSLFLRTPQHLMFLVALVFPIMVFLSARVVFQRISASLLIAGLAIFLAYGQGFFLRSDFLGLIGPFHETAGERATIAAASVPSDRWYRTLYVPNAGSYYYHPGVFDYRFESGDEPQIPFLGVPTIGAAAKWTPYERTQHLLMALDEMIPDSADAQTQKMLLQISSIHRIVVHAIGAPGSGVRNGISNARPSLERALAQTGIAVREQSLDDRSIWNVKDGVQRTYAPDCLFGVPPAADPYDVLALAPAAATCARPATIVAPPGERSEEILPAVNFQSDPRTGIALGRPSANVAIALDGFDGFVAAIPRGVQDVEMLALPPVPKGTTGIAFRMSTSTSRRVWVQLYAPDSNNYYMTNVDFSGRVQDVALNFDRFGRVGQPRVARIRYLRFASQNTQLRESETTFSTFRWIDYPQQSISLPYLAITRNLWDQFYFGGDREHVVFEALPDRAPVYARARIVRAGMYDIVAHVQQSVRPLLLQVAVDGRRSPCSPDILPGNVTERLVHLARVSLRTGTHTFALRFCRVPPPLRTQDVGVRSLLVVAARFAPPARRMAGSARIVAQGANTLRVATTGTLLVFSDSYDDRWSASQHGIPLSHVLVNGYANGWLVPHPHAGDVHIAFGPQKALTLGIALTVFLALLALAIIAFLVIDERRAARTG